MTLKGFDVFITLDKNLQYQQNLKRFSIQIIILDATDTRYQSLETLVSKVKQALSKKISGQILIIS
jgi:hypothetical protein